MLLEIAMVSCLEASLTSIVVLCLCELIPLIFIARVNLCVLNRANPQFRHTQPLFSQRLHEQM